MAQLKNNTTIGGNVFTVGTAAYFTTSGLVGIGTNTASTKTKLIISGGNIQIGSAGYGIVFPDGSIQTSASSGGGIGNPGGTSGAIQFNNSGLLDGDASKLAIDITTGSIGIGTTTVPTTSKLSIFDGNLRIGSSEYGIEFPDGTFQKTASSEYLTIVFTYTGNGITSTYSTLPYSVTDNRNTMIYISGVYQRKSTYTWSGTDITFDSPPVNGAAIEINVFTTSVSSVAAGELTLSGNLTANGNNSIFPNVVGIGTASVTGTSQLCVYSGNLQIGSSGFGIVFPDGTFQSTAFNTLDGLTSFSTTLSGLTPSSPATGAVILSGTLGVGNGGTGGTTFTSNGILYGNSTSALQATAQGGTNTVLIANNGAPSFSTTPTVTSLTTTSGFEGGYVSGTIFNVRSDLIANSISSNGAISGTTGTFTALQNSGITTVQSLTSNTSITASNGLTVSAGGATITGNLSVSGGIIIAGNISVNTSNVLVTEEPIIYVGDNNPANLWDLGIAASYTTDRYRHTGFARNQNDGVWTIFDNLLTEPTQTINWSQTGLNYGSFKTGNINVAATTSSTSTTTGAIITAGGVGIRGNLNVGGSANYFTGQTNIGSQFSVGVEGYYPALQVTGTALSASILASRWTNSSSGTGLVFVKSRGATVGTAGALSSGDTIAKISSYGSDGTANYQAAIVEFAADAAFSTGSSPGRITFSTTPSSSSTSVERMRIDSNGCVGIGTTNISPGGYNGTIYLTGNGNPLGGYLEGFHNAQIAPSTVTTRFDAFISSGGTSAASFTLNSLNHYTALSNIVGSGSTITNQRGFYVSSSLTGATNNYGFYGDIPSATGRYNLYMAGTADNYFAGKVGIGVLPSTGYSVMNRVALTGAINSIAYWTDPTIQSDVTGTASYYASYGQTAAANFTLPALYHFSANQGTIGTGSTVTNQFGFFANSSLTGATNNYGFYGNIASGVGRYNFYANGTADNYFSGNVFVGNSSALTFSNIVGTITPQLQLVSATSSLAAGMAIVNNTNAANMSVITFGKSRGNSTSSPTIVVADDNVGGLYFNGYDGSAYVRSAYISAAIDGTPATNNMPGRLVFATTPGGTAVPAERMRIDQYGNVSIGTTVVSYPTLNRTSLTVGGTTEALLAFQTGGTSRGYLYAANNNNIELGAQSGLLLIKTIAAQPIVFNISNTTEAMRISSSGIVGIGTNNPSGKLEVWSTTASVSSWIVMAKTPGVSNSTGIWQDASNNLQFAARDGSGALRVVIDSNANAPSYINAGSVGIGSSTPTAKLDVRGGNGTGGISGPTSGTWAAKIVMNEDNNSYGGLAVQNRWGSSTTPILECAAGWNGSTWGYYPAFSVRGDATCVWTATSGIEMMRITNAGLVGIGTNSPSDKLHLFGSSSILKVESSSTSQYDGPYLSLKGSPAGTEARTSALIHGNSDAGGTHNYFGVVSFKPNGTFHQNLLVYDYQYNYWTHYAGGSERMRIDGNGYVGIGTTNPATKLNVRGTWVNGVGIVKIDADTGTQYSGLTMQNNGTVKFYIYNDNTNGINYVGSATTEPLVFGYNATSERARIDGGGNLLVGYTTSNGAYKLQVNSQIFATSATIATSDARYKDNVESITDGLAIINGLNPVSFDWKQHPVHDFDTAHKQVGFLAQEVQEVLEDKPYLNSIIKANTCELPDGTREEFLGIAEGNMIAILTSAIKELTTEVESLKQRIVQLESK